MKEGERRETAISDKLRHTMTLSMGTR